MLKHMVLRAHRKFILSGIKIFSAMYLAVALVSKVIAVKVEPKGTKIW